jgi:hypothetical protein
VPAWHSRAGTEPKKLKNSTPKRLKQAVDQGLTLKWLVAVTDCRTPQWSTSLWLLLLGVVRPGPCVASGGGECGHFLHPVLRSLFGALWLKEVLHWQHGAAVILIMLAIGIAFFQTGTE